MVLDIFEVKYVDIDELIDTQGIKKIEFIMELPKEEPDDTKELNQGKNISIRKLIKCINWYRSHNNGILPMNWEE